MGRDPLWVLKDPLSRSYFHFTQCECALLKLADGKRLIPEIITAMSDRFPSASIELSAVRSFFADAMQKGLLTSTNSPAVPTSSRRWWQSAISYRFPGFNPTKALDRLLPWTHWLFAPWLGLIALLMAPLCLLMVMIQWDRFTADVTGVAMGNLSSVAVIAIAIMLAKGAHELSHALACRYFGCECREMGVMLLLGMPCLYVDVSDAWMLRSRRQRMMVSAAGMYAEVWIAMLATLAWWLFDPSHHDTGSIRDIAVTMMMVCSVSTLIINANPLLRYDGYYLLSDGLGVPNLASRAQASLRCRIRQSRRRPDLDQEPLWMSGYAAASLVYRWTILFTLAMMARAFLKTRGMELGASLVISLVLFFAILRTVNTMRPSPSNRIPSDGESRPMGKPLVMLAILIALLFIPFPQSVVAPMVIGPSDAQRVYLSESGFLDSEMVYGQEVSPGTMIASFQNPSLRRQHARAQAALHRIKTQLVTLRRSRQSLAGPANQIPSLTKHAEHATARLSLQEEKIARLTLTPATQGTLYRPENPVVGNEAGAWLTAGTTVGVLGSPDRREAILYLSERQISLARRGQEAGLLLGDAPRGSIVGKIIAIDAAPCETMPRSLLQSGWIIRTASGEAADIHYRVRVELDASGHHQLIRRIGRAKIKVASRSLMGHLYQWLMATWDAGSEITRDSFW